MASLSQTLKQHRFGILVFFLAVLAVENVFLIRQNRSYKAQLASRPDVAYVSSVNDTTQQQLVGAEAPPFTLGTLSHTQVSLKDYSGQPLVLIFFTTDCPACEETALFWEEAARKAGYEGAEIIAISHNTMEEVEEFKVLYDLALIICLDPDRAVFRDYGIRYISQAVWIDEEGWVRELGPIS